MFTWKKLGVMIDNQQTPWAFLFFSAKMNPSKCIFRKRDPSEALSNNNREAIGKVCWQLRRLSEELPKNPKNGTAKVLELDEEKRISCVV